MIPGEAVDAALGAMRGLNFWDYNDAGYMRASLEAAAPHMLAGLLSDLMKLAKEFDSAEGGTLAYTVSDGRVQMRKNAHDQLMYIVSDHDESQK